MPSGRSCPAVYRTHKAPPLRKQNKKFPRTTGDADERGRAHVHFSRDCVNLCLFVTFEEIYTLEGKSSSERKSRETVIISRGKFQQTAEEYTLMVV